MASSNAPFIYEPTIGTKQLPTTSVFGLPVPTATQAHEIGTKIIDSTYGTEYTYFKCDSGGLLAYSPVARSVTTLGAVSRQSNNASSCARTFGVAPYAVTANYYCFIATRGIARVLTTSTSLTGGEIMVPDVATSANAVTLAPGGSYSQAESVAALNKLGVTMGAESAGSVLINITK